MFKHSFSLRGKVMKIIIGKTSGFCGGVKRTVNKTEELLKNEKDIYSLGDIVHNGRVIDNLSRMGLKVVSKKEDINDYSKVIIRAHGETLDTYNEFIKRNIEIYDLTCGKVKLIHKKIAKEASDNFVIIIGKKAHPEVIAHKSYANDVFVIENEDDIKDAFECFNKSSLQKVYIVCQTTFNEEKFNYLVKKMPNVFINIPITIDNTICDATSKRQEETRALAKKVNAMIIIGGKNSSNTEELYIISKKYCSKTYKIETSEELHDISFNDSDTVGIMAGASTPDEVINEVYEFIENKRYL